MYLLLFFKQFKHAFHVDERVLDHSAEKQTKNTQKINSSIFSIKVHVHFFLPVVGAKPVERSVQLDDVGTEQDKISNLALKCKWALSLFMLSFHRIVTPYLKLSLGDKVGTKQGAGQKARSDDEVLGLIKKGQGGLGLPLWHLEQRDSHQMLLGDLLLCFQMGSCAAQTS